MQARTPEEKVDQLLTLRAKVDAELKHTLAKINAEPARKRSRLVVPECGTESAWQRHRYTGDTAGEKRRVNCLPCIEAHRLNNRLQYARALVKVAS